ncbi:Cytosolic acyl coenzyme A thioester hydrolase [Dissostichus eleginoides]|uniref:Cytosolic acyl coenzyme A thioester hydrolase n=1 Tax=Dissostichus eleginoides TaxID=100907 RepID=A0AAD9BP20_DISEL|nr:Cytosolic acyl coenzyme A thioester hydrolase [Dissostichus eleginoides]
MVDKLLLRTLKDLGKDAFQEFKWHLNQKNLDGAEPIPYASVEQEELGRKRYGAQKMERQETKARIEDVVPPPPNPGQHTVGFSQSSLIHLVGPSDCTIHNYVHGELRQGLPGNRNTSITVALYYLSSALIYALWVYKHATA